jgi:hypothetical protein
MADYKLRLIITGNSGKSWARSPVVIALLVGALFVYGMISLNDQVDSEDNDEPIVLPSWLSSIPEASVKVTPETDITPPLSESDEYYDPVPVPGLVNTAGVRTRPSSCLTGRRSTFSSLPT